MKCQQEDVQTLAKQDANQDVRQDVLPLDVKQDIVQLLVLMGVKLAVKQIVKWLVKEELVNYLAKQPHKPQLVQIHAKWGNKLAVILALQLVKEVAH